jgi:hypothetical protein
MPIPVWPLSFLEYPDKVASDACVYLFGINHSCLWVRKSMYAVVDVQKESYLPAVRLMR